MKLLRRALPALVAFALLSCGGDSKELVGDWTVVEAEGISASIMQDAEYTFRADGTMSERVGIFETDMTYVTAGDTLTTVQSQNEMTFTTKYLYTLADGKLTLRQLYSEQTLVLEK